MRKPSVHWAQWAGKRAPPHARDTPPCTLRQLAQPRLERGDTSGGRPRAATYELPGKYIAVPIRSTDTAGNTARRFNHCHTDQLGRLHRVYGELLWDLRR